MPKKLTPPQLAKLWGISCDKVIAWIRAGELRAIDASTKRGGRPRYLIDEDDVAAFERSRSTVATPPSTSTKRRRGDVPQYV